MPVRTDPSTAAARWATGMGQAGQKVADGVSRVQTAPGQKAAAKAQKWINAVNESAAKWQRNVGAVSLAEWQDKMLNVGVSRMAQGAQANQGKMEGSLVAFWPTLTRVVAQADTMDDSTLEGRIAKSVFVQRSLAAYRQSA